MTKCWWLIDPVSFVKGIDGQNILTIPRPPQPMQGRCTLCRGCLLILYRHLNLIRTEVDLNENVLETVWGKLLKNPLDWVIIDHNDNIVIETSQICIFNNKRLCSGDCYYLCVSDISLVFSTYPKQEMAYSAVQGRREFFNDNWSFNVFFSSTNQLQHVPNEFHDSKYTF